MPQLFKHGSTSAVMVVEQHQLVCISQDSWLRKSAIQPGEHKVDVSLGRYHPNNKIAVFKSEAPYLVFKKNL
jgi:hypothetical protein